MYEPHNPIWLTFSLLALVALGGGLVLRCRRRKVPISRPWAIGFGILAGLHLAVLLGIKNYDNWRLRQELANVVPAEVTHLVVRRGTVQKEILPQPAITQFLAPVQAVRSLPAHHSHPVDKFDFAFDYRGQRYHYQLGRDSERADEFWVFPLGRLVLGQEDSEMGRVRSAALGPQVNALLGTQP